ncbi:unnamed protein product, partial [marine sediment metagenome]
ISDIEFSYDIAQTEKEDIYTKNGLRIIPHTGGEMNKNEKIFLYFEIYNLSIDANGDGRYKIDYEIKKRDTEDKRKSIDEKEVITTSVSEMTKQRDTFHWISFDMSALSDGVCEMTIKVTDSISGNSATAIYSFMLGG